MRLAFLSADDFVVRILEDADPATYPDAVEADADAQIGWWYDGSGLVPLRPGPRSMDELELKRAFSQSERIAIRAARDTDTTVDDAWDLMETTFKLGALVRTDDPDFIATLTYLEAQGLIGAGRAKAIRFGV